MGQRADGGGGIAARAAYAIVGASIAIRTFGRPLLPLGRPLFAVSGGEFFNSAQLAFPVLSRRTGLGYGTAPT